MLSEDDISRIIGWSVVAVFIAIFALKFIRSIRRDISKQSQIEIPSSQEVDPASTAPVYLRWSYMKNGEVYSSDFFGVTIGGLLRTVFGLVAAISAFFIVSAFSNPVIGVLVALVIIAVEMKDAKRYGIWQGECPHCHEEIATAAGPYQQSAFNCPICTKRIFLKFGRFRPL